MRIAAARWRERELRRRVRPCELPPTSDATKAAASAYELGQVVAGSALAAADRSRRRSPPRAAVAPLAAAAPAAREATHAGTNSARALTTDVVVRVAVGGTVRIRGQEEGEARGAGRSDAPRAAAPGSLLRRSPPSPRPSTFGRPPPHRHVGVAKRRHATQHELPARGGRVGGGGGGGVDVGRVDLRHDDVGGALAEPDRSCLSGHCGVITRARIGDSATTRAR